MVSKGEDNTPKWIHPNEAMQLHKLKFKKKQLQSRINCPQEIKLPARQGSKRKNPFKKPETSNKKVCSEVNHLEDESSDRTLFSLFNLTNSNAVNRVQSSNIDVNSLYQEKDELVVVKCQENQWMPIDWALKTKIRLLSLKPFPWNQKLKINEESSGMTCYVRCLNENNTTKLDISPNAKFHQCCLYWQQPTLPWLNLFPRTAVKTSATTSSIIASQLEMREHLYTTWTNSFRSLFQLVRTRQCPYFYMCSNSFTLLLRAAGIGGTSEMRAMITPTTRGLRHLLHKEDIKFSMPLKPKGEEDEDVKDEEDEPPDEKWLESMGVCMADIQQINYKQQESLMRNECQLDLTEHSLILVEGIEVQALYNFLINTKSLIASTGTFAGIPPTLIAPVAFQGATLNALKVRENKVHSNDNNYFSLELSGPILPHMLHHLFAIQPPDYSTTATFAVYTPTAPFSKVAIGQEKNATATTTSSSSSGVIFGKENLSDCGLSRPVLQLFCESDSQYIQNVECIKYEADSKTFTWS